MKRICLFSLVALLMTACSQRPDDNIAVINGEVLSGNAKEVKFEWIVDNPISMKGETFVAEIDSNSIFSIEIPIERIANGRITIGKFYHDICCIPGDDFYVSIDSDRIQYSGKGSEKNNFLYHAEINRHWNRSFYRESNKGELTPAVFLDSMTRFRQKRIDFLNAYLDSIELQPEFADYYNVETQVIYESLIQRYPRRYAYTTGIPQDSLELPSAFKTLSNFASYIDDSKTVSSNYIHNLRNQLFTKSREITESDTSINMKEAIYIALFDSLSGKTREYVLTKWIITKFSSDVFDTVAIERFNEIDKEELAQSTFNAAYDKFNEKRSLINQPLHLEFSNTLLKDTSGTQLTFGEMMEEHKGKVVYVDFWGMGCGPCRAAMPYSKKLKEKLADEPVEFIYASVEQIRNNNWDKVFEATFTDRNHYVLENGFNSRLHRFMEINWVPSYMIFNREGKLVDFNADRPSSMVESEETELESTLRFLASN